MRASYALRRVASVTYGLKEGPVWPGAAPNADWLERLLEGGLKASGALGHDAAFAAPSLDHLLVTHGFSRIVSQLKEGVHRVVVERGRAARPVRLTRREFEVARLAALGWSSRHIGSELGIAGATVRGAVDRSVSKLALLASIQLPLLWHTLCTPARLVPAPSAHYLLFENTLPPSSEHLTLAERALLERLLVGDSYRDIAEHRRVSVRTVANQLSRLYIRLGVANRGELVALVLAGGSQHRLGVEP